MQRASIQRGAPSMDTHNIKNTMQHAQRRLCSTYSMNCQRGRSRIHLRERPRSGTAVSPTT
eukprot:8828679-Alexandrium_andersonii.AAC.1